MTHDDPTAVPTPEAATSPAQGFAELGLTPELLKALAALGYEEPTPIQREAIPHLLEGRDLLGLAATGTGKTAAFALPMLQLLPARGPAPAALVLVPTRELAVQVAQAVHRYGRGMGIEVLPIYGGQSFGQQLKVLKRGVDVVVATPGRALDHVRRGTLDLGSIDVLVLDEADEMLDMGFADDLDEILAETPPRRQTLLFSATLGPRIEKIANKHLTDPVEVRIGAEPESPGEVPLVRQTAYLVHRAHKLAALGRVLDLESPDAALVFCRTRNEVDELVEALSGRGYRAEAMHGGMSQEERDRVMRKLRGGAVDLLIATDVAARGLDIAHLTHVINYDVPSAPTAYVHRIGRVGRAGREGVAITLADPREHGMLRNVERLTRQKITVASLPTVADLKARRLELTRASIREAIVQGDLGRYRVVVEALSDEFDVVEVALGAIRLAHEALHPGGESGEQEIPVVRPPSERSTGSATTRRTGTQRSKQKGARGPGAGAAGEGGSQTHGPAQGGKGGKGGKGGQVFAGTRLYIGAGRSDGIRPADLVGAITGESGISGREIGSIQIGDRFSLVEVADGVAAQVLGALRGAKIKGKKVTVRPDRGR